MNDRPSPAFSIAPWPTYPGDGPHGEAVAVAHDSGGRVFVFLRGPQSVRIHSQDGAYLGGWGEELFVRPHGLTIGPDDTVYCVDDFDHTVRAFTLDGRLLLTLGTRGVPSDTGATSVDYRTIRRSGPPFHYPTNLAVAPSGDLYIADGYGNARIHRFTSDGRLLRSWGEPGAGPGQFHVPHGIAVDADGTVYVADRENSRVQLFSPQGDYLREWAGLARPSHLHIDRERGWFYIAELGYRAGRWPGTGSAAHGDPGGRVSLFDRSGELLARWGEGHCFAPHGISVSADGSVYIAEVAVSAGGPRSSPTLHKFVPG